MNRMMITYFCLMLVINTGVSANIILNPVIPEVNKTLTVSCSLSGEGKFWSIPGIGKVLCKEKCLPQGVPDMGYTFTVNSSRIEGVIQSMNRPRDERVWNCGTVAENYSISLQIYTIPLGLELTQIPNDNVDLSVSSTTLMCRTTSCAYPELNIEWLYKNQLTSTKYEAYTATVPNVTTLPCASSEKDYSSILYIAQNTTWTDNSDKTVTFACRIGYIDPSKNITSVSSKTVQFAVMVTEAFLQHNNQNITDTLIVTSGETVNLTCVTGISRPASVMYWYLGSEWKGSGSILTLIPSNNDHNKTVCCQVYNIMPSQNIYSNKPMMFVRVRVTEAVLQWNSQNITDTLTVTSGETVNLTCMTGISRPAPTIEWYLGSEKKGNGSSLTFTPSNADHNRTIFCQVYNTMPSQKVDSNKSKLFVRVNVSMVILEGSRNGTIVFYEGLPKILKCISSPSRPVPKITWWLGNTELIDTIANTNVSGTDELYVLTSEIKLILVRNNTNQKIHCEGSISVQGSQAVSNQANVDVWYKPSKPKVEAYMIPFPWMENQTGILQCYSMDYGNPKAIAKWIIAGITTDATGNLVIQKLASSDNGRKASCQLVNNYTVDMNASAISDIITLNVEYSPIIEFNTSSSLRVNETQSISILCNASGNPDPDPPQWRGRSAGSILRFDNISRIDNGTYICNTTARLHNMGILEKRREFEITVQYAPDVSARIDGITQQNMTSSIVCDAQGFPPQYTFHPWRHMWGEIVIRSEILTGRTNLSRNILELGNLSLQDMGTYVCLADNGIKGINGKIKQTGNVHLSVTGVPNILNVDSSMFHGATGHLVIISIPFYSDPAINNFAIYKNGTAVMNTSRTKLNISSDSFNYKFYNTSIKLDVQTANLFIQNLTQNDFDNYTLALKNTLGSTDFRFYINVSGAPLKCDRFYFNRFIGNSIELHFVPSFNGGLFQTFVIEYKSKTSSDSSWRNTSIIDLRETQTEYRLPNGTFSVNITQPLPGSYVYRMYSWNVIGVSPYSAEITVFIPKGEDNHPDLQVAAIAGGIGAAAALMIASILVVVIFVKRRSYLRRKSCVEDFKGSLKEQERPEAGLIDNPVYDTSGPLPGPSTINSTAGVEYALVIKQQNTAAALVDNQSMLYARVKKTKGKKKNKGDVFENVSTTKRSTCKQNVYENSEDLEEAVLGENVYENPASDTPVKPKNGLIYADLMLCHPTATNGKPVIWGIENRTEYADIAFCKRVEPLPQSDEDKETSGT